MALAAGRSTVLTLCVSDIIGSPLHAIAGGPTTADPITLDECRDILTHLSSKRPLAPSLHRAFFSKEDAVSETPKAVPSNILMGNVLVDLSLAIEAAARECKTSFPEATVVTLSSRTSGEAAELGRFLARIGTDVSLRRPFVLLGGGETTVTMDSARSGLGGRNQELALAAAIQMSEDQECTNTLALLAIGTDGTDGPTPAAGACVTKMTLKQSTLVAAHEALDKHDSYNFFNTYAHGDHIITGPTGTNVMDFFVVCDFPLKPAI